MVITDEMIVAARSRQGFTAEQIRMARILTGRDKKPIRHLAGMDISEPVWDAFIAARDMTPEKIKAEKKKARKKPSPSKTQRLAVNPKFYISTEWRMLRVEVMERYGCRCMMCGRSPKEHGIVIHIDHIKPKSLYPELSLDADNLQILCDDCNIGKSNLYDTDWRPHDQELDRECLTEALQRI